MNPNQSWVLFFGLLAALLLTTCLGSEAKAAPSVRIDNFTFTPQEITITRGTTLTWVNDDDIPHTVAATTQAFRSKAMDTEQKFSFTFTEPGTYEYFCSLHPHMQGKVIVKE
ncbi:MAG: cupredoxin family copper-binding protein [Rhodomicrobium sp.]